MIARLTGLALALFTAIFGSYLIYEKVILPLRTGIVDERIGLIERSTDPVYFWISVVFYAAIGGVIAALGLYFIARALRR